jgi:hypothetical protein
MVSYKGEKKTKVGLLRQEKSKGSFMLQSRKFHFCRKTFEEWLSLIRMRLSFKVWSEPGNNAASG